MTNEFSVKINGTPYPKAVFPLKTAKLLDEQLDEAYLTMVLCKEEHFDTLSPVQIEITTKGAYGQILGTRTDHYVIANDRSFLMIKDKNLYRHEIYLIEETKLLEGLIGDSIVFTNSLGNMYLLNVVQVTPSTDMDSIAGGEATLKNIPSYKTPLPTGDNFYFVPANDLFDYDVTIGEEFSFKTTLYYEGNIVFTTEDPNLGYTEKLRTGSYRIDYFIKYQGLGIRSSTTSFEFNATSNRYPLKKWTITDVVQRTLDLIEPHIDGIPNRFTFNEAQAEEYSNVIAPEFAFTKENLRERLQQIGGFIHAEPRLRDGVIYFDKYGQTDYANIVGFKVTSKAVSQDINQYATNLDSSVDNFVSQLSWAKGVVMETFAGGYRSVRTESYNVRITEDNMLIQTIFPIYQVEKLVCSFIKDGELITCDITPYVFESVDYNSNLSSYREAYPTSKSYGIYYTQGERGVNGLSYKVPTSTGTGAFTKYAIVNIVEAASGISFSNWFEDVAYPTLMFQISYLPIFSTRVTQTKQYTVGMKTPFAMPYNQSANLIETAYYGENMKGLIARLGNVEKTVTYTIYNPNDIPTPGQLYDDDYYISAVYTEFMPGYIKLQLTLSKDFNRLSKYISVPSYKRYYEISERQAFRRETLYTDYLVIGDEEEADGQELIGYNFLSHIKSIFTQGETNGRISLAKVWGKDKKGNLLNNTVILPVLSTAMGTTMNFSFITEDNYSAGARSVYQDTGRVKGYFQQYVPYGDYYGRMYYLNFHMAQVRPAPFSAEGYLEEAMANPLWTSGAPESTVPLIGTNTVKSIPQKILYRKDSREILNFTYQASFVTNWKNIIIGSALAAMNPLIKGSERDNPAGLFISPTRINKFDDFVDVSGMTQQVWTGSANVTITGTVMNLGQITASVAGKAWAIVYSPNQADTEITVEDEDGTVMTQTIPVGDRLLIACNTDITAGQVIQLPNISIVHDIYSDPRLAAPIISLLNGVVSWSAVKNATKYKVYANGELMTTVTTTNVNLTALSLSIGLNVITVQASCDEGYLDSGMSNEIGFVVGTITLTISGSTITWTDTATTDAYDVRIQNASSAATTTTRVTNAKTLDLSTVITDSGTYYVTVLGAYMLNGSTVHSNASNTVSWAYDTGSYTITINTTGEHFSVSYDLDPGQTREGNVITGTVGTTVSVHFTADAGYTFKSASYTITSGQVDDISTNSSGDYNIAFAESSAVILFNVVVE